MDKGRSSRLHDNKRYSDRRILSSRPKTGHYRSRDDRHHHGSSSLLKSDYRNYKIVEYSDVSSEDGFSAPEAGELEDEDIYMNSDKETSFQGSNSNGKSLVAGSSNNRMHDDDMEGKTARRDSEMSRLDFVMSPGQVRKVIIGSPISSSVSSNSRSKTRRSISPVGGHTNKKLDSGSRKHSDGILVTVATSVDGSSVSPIDDIEIIENDEGLEEEDGENDNDASERRRRKNKKSKKKKSKKKKKKRRKSISSISISEVDSLIDEAQNVTPPRPVSPWEKTYTPLKPIPLSPGPVTPPLRPTSTISMYSDDLHSGHGSRSRGGGGVGGSPPPLLVHRDKIYVSSPHTPPPIVPKKSYPNNEYHHQRHTHQPRSPPPTNRRSSKSPSMFS